MDEINPQQIAEMSLKASYDLLLALPESDSPHFSKVLDSVKYGVRIKFNIYDYFNEKFIIRWKARKIDLYCIGKRYNLDAFHSEIEARTKAVKRALIEILSIKDDKFKGKELEVDRTLVKKIFDPESNRRW